MAPGGPLSPTLFNLTLQLALRQLPENMGTGVGDVMARYLQFADDIALIATTRAGLQLAINTLLDNARRMGLESVLGKCATLGICTARGTWYADSRPFTYEDILLPVVEPDGFYKYLAISIGSSTTDGGRCLFGKIQDSLDRLNGAPLKPKQKLWGLKRVLLPRFIHPATFSNPTQVRAMVRRALNLPKDTTKAAFHASTKEGALGIASLATAIPALVKNRLKRLE